MAAVGPTLINKNCIKCRVSLEINKNWCVGNAKAYAYLCRPCDAAKRKRNNLKKLAREIGELTLRSYNKVKEGHVYIITNPAWEGWVKVGMAIDAEDRASNYQTSSPYRDYELVHIVDTKDRRATEAETHARLGDLFEQRNEWFKCSVERAKRIMDDVVKEEEQYDEAC